jgi:ganglioside-induced differentiation-associated protein 1
MQVVSPLIGQTARRLAGLHLFHYGLSHSSQKVRLVLAEKGLGWTSHHLDLTRHEHAAPSYLEINPDGVVPTLVHDGITVIESSDIMEYLDEEFPDPPLRPAGERELVQMRLWVARQDSLQRHIEVLSREFLFPDVSGNDPHPSPTSVACALRAVEDALAEANRHLVDREWFVGDTLSLADLAWVVVVHRMTRMDLPMRKHRALRAWYQRMQSLRSVQQAVLSYETPELRRTWRRATLWRWLVGTYVGAARWRAPRLLADA